MQRLTMVRYTVKPEAAEENVRLSRAVFDALRRDRPEGIAYATYRLGDEFIHLFLNQREDDSAVLTESESFKAYAADIAARCLVPPQAERHAVELVDSYGLPT